MQEQNTMMASPKDGAGHGLGLCLLSLDGGGVRGLSSLLILKKLMEGLDPDDPPKPCDYFDLIGGTSTGGLIAIMLGRLRMDVDQCIEAYKILSPAIFTKLHHRVNVHGRIQGRFDHGALERGIKEILIKHGFAKDELFKEKSPVCRTFVCATSRQTSDTVVLSSYYSERRGNDLRNIAKIWEVARATSAATSFFDPIQIGGEGFVDGATGANNPINEIWTEASDIWSEGRGWKLEDNLKCLVSIERDRRGLGRNNYKYRAIADTFEKQNTHLYQHGQAFRFNVEQGLELVGLEQADKLDEIQAVTRRYIQTEKTFVSLKTAVTRLKERAWIHTLFDRIQEASILALEMQRKACDFTEGSSLEWFLHTSHYNSWLHHGGVLWYKKPSALDSPTASPHVVLESAAYCGLSQDIDTRVLYFHCCADSKGTTNSGKGSMSHTAATTVAEILSSLTFQALDSDDLEAGDIEAWIKGLNMGDQQVMRNLLMQRNTIVALQNAENIDPSRASELLSKLSTMAAAGKCRLIIGAIPTQVIQAALAGVHSIDHDTEYRECLQTMDFEAQHVRLEQIAAADSGTTDWLWCHRKYLGWQHSQAAILWVEGKPGSGKSVLAKAILRQLATETDQKQAWIIGHWFYSTRGGEKLISHESLLLSILQQLLKQDKSIFPSFEESYRRSSPGSKQWWTSNAELINIFDNIAHTGASVTCIIDAMDESQDNPDYDNSREAILTGLSRMVSDVEKSRIKLIILSRPFLDIDVVLSQHQSRYGNVYKLVLELENMAAIAKLVDNGMLSIRNTMRRFDIGNEKSPSRGVIRMRNRPNINTEQKVLSPIGQGDRDAGYEGMRKYIFQNAQGVVLWVKLIVTVLERRARQGLCSFSELELVLRKLPLEIDTMYRHMIQDLRDRLGEDGLRKTRDALMWISGANLMRPFTLEQLREALAVPSRFDASSLTHGDPIERNRIPCAHWTSFVRQLRHRCGAFIEVIRAEEEKLDPPLPCLNLRPTTLNQLEEKDSEEDEYYKANDVVQLLHRTAKDFFASKEGAGLLAFTEREASRFVQEGMLTYLKVSFPDFETPYSPLPVKEGSDLLKNIDNTVQYLEDRCLLPFIMAVEPYSKPEDLYLFGPYVDVLDNLTYPALDNLTATQFLESHRGRWRFLPHRLLYGDLYEARSIIAGEFTYCACSKGMKSAVEALFGLMALTMVWHQIPAEAMIHAYCLVAVEQQHVSYALESPSVFFPPIIQQVVDELKEQKPIKLREPRVGNDSSAGKSSTLSVSSSAKQSSTFLKLFTRKKDDDRSLKVEEVRSISSPPVFRGPSNPDYHQVTSNRSGRQSYDKSSIRSFALSTLEIAAVQTGNWKLITLLYCARYRTALRGLSPYVGRSKGVFDKVPVKRKRDRRSHAPPPREYSRWLKAEEDASNTGSGGLIRDRGRAPASQTNSSSSSRSNDNLFPRACQYHPPEFIFERPLNHALFKVTTKWSPHFVTYEHLEPVQSKPSLLVTEYSDRESGLEWYDDSLRLVVRRSDLFSSNYDDYYYPASLVYGVACEPEDRFSVKFVSKLIRETITRAKSRRNTRVRDDPDGAILRALATTRDYCVLWWRRWGYSAASPRVVEYPPARRRADGAIVSSSRFFDHEADTREQLDALLEEAELTEVFGKH
ncbi:NACHT domain-containing protein [Cladophialophora immunda]|nr:NACHT domain-containing protein [Cladophialophora immunda]